MAGSSAPPKGCLFAEPYNRPVINGTTLPFSYRYFYLTGTLTQATVYQDGYLSTPFTQPVIADANGRFPPVYLDPSVVYKTVLYNSITAPQETADPIIQQPPSLRQNTLSGALSITSLTLTVGVQIPSAGTYAYDIYVELQNGGGATQAALSLLFPSGSIQPGTAAVGAIIGSDNTPSSLTLNTGHVCAVNSTGTTGLWLRGVLTTTAAGPLQLDVSNNGAGGTVQMNAGSYMLVQPILNKGIIFREPQNKPLAAAGSAVQTQPGAYRLFYYTGTTAPAPVYADAGLQRPLSQVPGQQQPSCTADGNGRFSVIYLDPAITYQAQLWNAVGTAMLEPTVDPYVPRAFEPITAVKAAPTVRVTGTGVSADPALQITLNPGTYAIDSMLEFATSTTGLTANIVLKVIGGTGTVGTSGTASSLVYEGQATGGAAVTGSFAVGATLSLTQGSAGSLGGAYTRGSVTITGAAVTFGVAWSATGTAGATLGLNAGSYIQAIQIGKDVFLNQTNVPQGVLMTEPTYDPIAPGTNAALPSAQLIFWLSRTSGALQTPAAVYQDGNLQTPYPTNVVTASTAGAFPPIYLNPSTPLRVQLFNAAGQLLQDVDPYVLNSRFIYTAAVPTTLTQTNNTTLTPDEFLFIDIPYAGTYRYELHADFLCSANSGTNPNANVGMFLEGGGNAAIQFNVLAANGGLLQDVAPPVQIPGGTATAFAAGYFVDPAGSTVYGVTAAYNTNGLTDYPITLSTSTQTPLHATGVITCTAPCTLAFAWSQNVSSAVGLQLLPGSYLKVQSIESTNGLIAAQSTSGAVINVVMVPSSLTTGFDATSGTTATINVVATGGAGGYTYAWSLSGTNANLMSVNSPTAASTTIQIAGMVAGNTYTATATCLVTDASGAQAQVSCPISIQCNAALTAVASPTSLSAGPSGGDSLTTGSTTVTAGGGQTPYSYSWAFTAGGAGMTFGSPSLATTNVTGTRPGGTGTAQCTVTDAFNNTVGAGVSISITFTPFTAAASPTSLSAGPSVATSLTTGASTVTASGAQPPYSYSWSFPVGGTDMTINSPNSAATTVTGTQVGYNQTGTMICTVTDALGYPTSTSGVAVAITCQDYSGTITLGTSGGSHPSNGFSNGGAFPVSFGSISPTADVQGHTISEVATGYSGLAYTGFSFALAGTVPQTYMQSITTGGHTYPTATATGFEQSGGYTVWSWNTSFPEPSWGDSASGAASLTIP